MTIMILFFIHAFTVAIIYDIGLHSLLRIVDGFNSYALFTIHPNQPPLCLKYTKKGIIIEA